MHRQRKVVWNEENLEENEKIKAEYAHVHIDEPDTPYNANFKDDNGIFLFPHSSFIHFFHSFLIKLKIYITVSPDEFLAALNALSNKNITEENENKPRYCETVHEFEERRKKHYDEYRRVQELKELIKKEEEEEEEEEKREERDEKEEQQMKQKDANEEVEKKTEEEQKEDLKERIKVSSKNHEFAQQNQSKRLKIDQ